MQHQFVTGFPQCHAPCLCREHAVSNSTTQKCYRQKQTTAALQAAATHHCSSRPSASRQGRALRRCVMRRSRAAARHISSVWCVMLS